MKRILLLALLGSSAVLIPTRADAFPRDKPGVQRITRNDGNASQGFAIQCTSSAWTVVGSSLVTRVAGDPLPLSSDFVTRRRRSMTVQTTGTVTYAVCITSVTSSTQACDDTAPGYELGNTFGSVTIFNETLWNCRTRTGGSTYIKGVSFFDDRDEIR